MVSLSRKNILRIGAIFVVVGMMLALFVVGASAKSLEQTNWTLVWSDEFNGSGQPNSANWNYHVGNGYNPGLPGFQGWGNGEWEWYRPEECYQSGGNLVLRAEYFSTPTSIAGSNWYQRSCRITTQGKKSFTYGAIEARIQAPMKTASWPAFWMLGDSSGGTYTTNYAAPITAYDNMVSNWASCGEVDIFEHKNADANIVNNIFWDLRTGVFPWTAGQNANYAAFPAVASVATWHTYRLEWDATYMRWFIDGVQTHVIDITPATLEEFHKPMYLIMNLAVSGAFTGPATPNIADFPMYMNVDYVRVYQAGGTNPTPVPTTPPPTTPPPSSGVIFYQDINYGGAASGAKGIGDYASLPGDVPNDWMSSLRVPSGWTVLAYENGNFGGAVCTFTANTPWVGSACNDRMSSFKIQSSSGGPTATPPPSGSSQGVVNVSSNQARVWYKCSGTCSYVVLHYIRPGLVQQNVQMSYNSSLARWEYLVTGITSGQVLQYQFTYNDGTQKDTAWYSWTKP